MAKERADTNRHRSKGAAARAPHRGLLRRLIRPKVLAACTLAAAAGTAWPHLARWSQEIERRPEVRVTVQDLRVTPPTPWVPVDLVEQVLRNGELPAEASLADETLLPRVAAAFEAHPWVRRVVRMRASAERGLEVELEYRSPVTMVRTARGSYPVDRDGVLLPPDDFSAADAQRLPLVENVQTTPDGPAGSEWGDPVVTAAAELASVLAPEGDLFAYWDRYDLRAVIAPQDSRRAVDELTFELETRGGSRIIWGRPPGADSLEPSAEQKLGRLDAYLETYGRFETPRGPVRIDIREYDVISLQSLDSARREL